jgi:hypothetical protein
MPFTMTLKRYAAVAALALSLTAQTRETYKARLSPVPADARTRAELTGTATATATLEGTKLTVTGSFEGLKTPVTIVNLHAAVAAGVRGPVIADLTAPKSTAGPISGSVDLTAPQIENLHHGGLYVEIHSEKAPDGVLWGWLLKP